MIQRPQTLYLLGIVFLQFILFFTPLMTAVNAVTTLGVSLYSNVYTNRAGNVSAVHDGINIWMTVMNGLVIIISLITIFLYRKRMLQLRLSRFTGLLIIILIAMIFYASERAETFLSSGHNFSYSYQYGIAFPILSLILVILAGRGIISDERKVRSADRLR